MQWLARGWALVPLHDVFHGHCSCSAGPGCRSAGKHPRARGWQDESQLVRDPNILQALVDAHPEWNWGVATGAASGIWVLDWDQGHQREILEWLTDRGIPMGPSAPPAFDTLQLGPTGGGGYHYVFALPPDFEVRGSQTKNRHGLPPGLDVRGHHGQIVVAPSVSGKGPYGAVLVDAPARRAPAWLEDMLRPQAVDERVDRPAPVADLRLSGPLPDSTGQDVRAVAYAQSAVSSVLGELAGAPVGTRNDTAYRVACRLIELGNAPWCPWSPGELEANWWEAGAAHPDGLHVPSSELAGVWRRAELAVGGAAAVLPASALGGEHVPILGLGPPVVVPDFPAAGALPLLDPGASAGDGVTGGVPVDPIAAFLARMLTPEQLRALPPPRPLVRGLLDLDTCAWLIGKPGSCKSFVALDLAVHIGRGEPWQGRPVHQGLAWYIAAEGAGGMTLRAAAVEREYEEIKEVRFLPEPVPADERRMQGNGAWSVMVAAAALERPVMIIIDTQARVTIGLNENDNADMGYYAQQADRLRRASGACVLTVHHQGRTGQNARGASAIDGAQDAELRIERAEQSMVLKVHVDKQKDQAQAEPIELGLRRSEGGVSPDGRDLSSLVIVRGPAPGDPLPLQDPSEPVQPKWQARMIALYHLILDRYNAGAGGTEAEIRKAFKALPDVAALSSADSQDKAWTRAWNGTATAPGLVARGLIAQKAGAARFKIIVLEDQSADGVLTPNDSKNPTTPPEGWNLYLPDLSPRS
jgi:AAA domain/Bifunctional DNA primase/polymerase, N-terminal